jgi:hypothetical protein
LNNNTQDVPALIRTGGKPAPAAGRVTFFKPDDIDHEKRDQDLNRCDSADRDSRRDNVSPD